MDDLISRQAAIAAIQNLYPGMPGVNVCDHLNKWREKNKEYIECEEIIKKLPSVKPKKGKWIECERVDYTQFHPDYSSFYSTFRCTSCLKANYRKEKYCPNCGAKMEGEQI